MLLSLSEPGSRSGRILIKLNGQSESSKHQFRNEVRIFLSRLTRSETFAEHCSWWFTAQLEQQKGPSNQIQATAASIGDFYTVNDIKKIPQLVAPDQ